MLIDAGSKGTRVGTDNDGVNDELERNIISGNALDGIAVGVRETDDTIIRGNYIGTDVTGELDFGNSGYGVMLVEWFFSESAGAPKRARVENNVVSGNNGGGVLVQGPGSDSHRISGNKIGTNKTGTVVVANGVNGIRIAGGAKGTTVGTNSDGVSDSLEGNLVSGNNGQGIRVTGAGTDDSIIAGNLIGVNALGAAAIQNTSSGLLIDGSALRTRVGTDGNGVNDVAERNIISGNNSYGVLVSGTGTNNSMVAGNYIGTDLTGSSRISNNLYGVSVQSGALNTRIGTDGNNNGFDSNERNVISGNNSINVFLAFGAAGTVVAGNYVGLNAAGTASIGNGSTGVYLWNGANNIRVGTDGNGIADDIERNVISGSSGDGITINNPFYSVTSTTKNVIAGNFIGLNAAGNAAVANAGNGIGVYLGANNTRIGTDGSNDTFNANERNVISGNGGSGISVTDSITTGTVIAGNTVGLNAAGNSAVPNTGSGVNLLRAVGVRIGTNADGIADDAERNFVSGNLNNGIQIQGGIQEVFGLVQVDQMIAATMSSRTSTGTITQADFSDATSPSSGNWAFNSTIPGGGGDNYAVVSTGTRQVNTAGPFSFAIAGNEGGRLKIDGATIISDDSIHSHSARYGTATLTAGTHTFEWIGFEWTGTSGWELSVAVGGGNATAISTANGWKVVGDSSPHSQLGLSGPIQVTTYYSNQFVTTATSVSGNYIGTNATGVTALGNGVNGLIVDAGATNTSITSNLFASNVGAGLRIPEVPLVPVTVRYNQFRQNALGVDLGGTGRTANDSGDTNGVKNAPVITTARIDGTFLVIEGYARPGTEFDVYDTASYVSGFGQGERFVSTLVEGSASDLSNRSSSYGPTVNGVNVGNDTTNRFKFSILLSTLPPSIAVGTNLTAIAIGPTSEFSAIARVGVPDVTLPTSSVQPLSPYTTSPEIPISVVGNDPTGLEGPASGIMEYDLYVAVGTGAFSKFATVPATNPNTVFIANSLDTYYFRSVARDNEGNEEIETGADTSIRFGEFPDLKISGLKFDTPSVVTGQDATISWTVSNHGNTSTAGIWTDRITVVNQSTGQTLFTQDQVYNSGSIPSGANSQIRTATFRVQDGAPGVGQLLVAVIADIRGQVLEFNPAEDAEANNSATTTAQSVIGPYPELSVSNVIVPTTTEFGNAFTVSWTVQNSGNAPLVNPISDRIYLSIDGILDASDTLLSTVASGASVPLTAGSSYTKSTEVAVPIDYAIADRQFRIIVVSDALGQQFELNESNNSLSSSPFQINVPPLPDLVVTEISTVAEAITDQPVTISWTVRNQGSAIANGPWTDQVHYSNDATIGSDITLGTFTLAGSLQPSESITRTQTVYFPRGVSGVKRIVVSSDTLNSVFELSNENNNTSIDDVTVNVIAPALPNLIVDSVNVPATAFSGQQITIDWVVKNIGTGSTNALGWVDRVYLSLNDVVDSSDVLLGSVQNSSYLNPGESYNSSLTAQLPQGIESNYRFIVVTDATNRVWEPDAELDNARVSSVVTVSLTPPPDLFVNFIQLAPSQVFSGDQMTVSWTVVNQGTGPTLVAGWFDDVFVSFNGDQLDAADTFLASVPHEGILLAGASYAVGPITITLPIGRSGDAHIIVRTDRGNQVFEHVFETNNRTSRHQFVTSIPPADLEVTSINAPRNAVASQPFSVSYTVANLGATATTVSKWTDSVYLSPTSTLDLTTATLLGALVRYGTLTPGQSRNHSQTLNLPNALTGTFYVIVAVDSLNEVEESDNSNNIFATSTTTNISFAPPDLVVSALSIAIPALSGTDLQVTYTVTNQGNSPTAVGTWSDAIYLSADPNIDENDQRLVLSSRSGVLGAGQSQSRTVAARLPVDRFGAFYIIVVSDLENLVFEANETNNANSVAVSVLDNRPDLVVRDFSPILPTSSVLIGTTLSFDYSIENRGAGRVSNRWYDRLILSADVTVGNADDQVLGSYNGAVSLAAGEIYGRNNLAFSIPLLTLEGSYFLFLETDYRIDGTKVRGEVIEQSETNNLFLPIPIGITTTQGVGSLVSDLQVSSMSAPATVNSGDSLSVTWSVTNAGTARTNVTSWRDSVWLSTDTRLDNDRRLPNADILLGSFTRSLPLDVGQNYAGSATIPLDIDFHSTYYVIVETDSNGDVFEGARENNNARVSSSAMSIRLTPTADLEVTGVMPPLQVNSGRPMTVSWTVNNLGAGIAAPSWADQVFLSTDQVFDPASDIKLGYVEHTTPLTPSSQYTATGTFMIPSGLGGLYYVFVAADSNKRVYERDGENNNFRYAPQSINIVYLPPADLVVGEITIPTNGTPGQNATISFSVNNTGVNAAIGSWSDALYISADDKWDIDDGFFGRVTHSGTVEAGDRYNSSLTAPLPGVLPGNYRVIVRSDIRNNLPESNENNNLSASLLSFVLDAPVLTLGVAQTGNLLANGAVYYRVDVAMGETLVFEFDSQGSSGFTEIYASFGSVPSRSRSDYSAIEPFHQDQRIVVPVTRGGTYYLMAFGTDVANGVAPFSIVARTVNFTVFDTEFGNIGASGNLQTVELRSGEDLTSRNTIRINGAKFTGNTKATLVRNGQTIDASSYWMTDTTTIYATFDLPAFGSGTEYEYGRYGMRVSDPNHGTVTVANSVNVVPNTRNNGRILTRFVGASTVVLNGTYPVDLQIGNGSTADTYAPLITLSSTRAGTPFGTSLDDLSVQTMQFLGIRNTGPAGIYSPIDSGTFNFYYHANSTNVAIDMGVITAQDTTPIDWSSIKESLRPASISTDAWTPIFQNLTSSIATWGQYVIMLNENATALSQLGQRVSDLATLWSYEVQQAMGTLGPVQTLASAIDASVVSPGLSLGLSRSFGANLADRNATSIFGRGWSTTWDTYLNVTTDGTVNILDSAGLRRQFTPVANQPGQYTAQPGDSGVLSFFNGSWQIQESSGSITGFRADGRIDYFEDVNTNRITAGYTAGRLTSLTHSSGQFLTITNNGAGRPITVTDSAGRVTTYTYDPSNTYLLSAAGSDGITTSYTYQTSGTPQVQGALLSVTTAGVSQLFTFDARGRIDTTSQNGGTTLITYTYDNAGRVNVADNLGTTSLFYDARGLLSRTQDPFGNYTTALYGDDRRIAQLIDPLGQTQAFTWCDCGSLTSSTDQLGNTTRFSYEWISQNNTIRRMMSFTDANGNVTRYTYDSRGNRTSTIYADGTIEFTNAYDAEGNPLRYTNRRGQVMQYQYNAAGQVSRQTFDDGSYIDLAYDARGNLTTVTEPGSRTTTYAYDTADRLTRVTYPEGRFLDYTYDASGRRASITDQTGYRTNYFYDALGRLSRLTDTAGVEIVRYTYDAGGRLLRTDKGNGTYTINTYDAAGQITSLVNYAPNGSINSRFDYTYDALGRRTSQNTIDGRWVYGYDSTGQLTSGVFTPVPGSVVPAQNLQYSYDAVGNRVRTVENGVVAFYITNGLNQYTEVGNRLLSYDADGNLIRVIDNAGESTYVYDQQSRLTQHFTSGVSTQYTYDAFGYRRSSVTNGMGTAYVIDPIGLYNVVSVFDAGSSTPTRFTYGLGLIRATYSSGSSTEYYAFDDSGSMSVATDQSGDVVGRHSYDPFGNLTSITGSSRGIGFVGEWGVSTEGQSTHYMRARYYDSTIGRFTTTDPISIASGEWNLYIYGGNNPISTSDPTGLIGPGLIIAGGLVGGGVGAGWYWLTTPSEQQTWQGYAGAAVSGAIQGATVVMPSRLVSGAAGAALGGLGSLVGSGVEVGLGGSKDPSKVLSDALASLIPIPLINRGNPRNTKNFWRALDPLSAGGKANYSRNLQNAIGGGLLQRTADEIVSFLPTITVPRSGDPNDILGPDGVGAERWISAANPINYTIRFENDPLLANAPAQVVRITQTLDSELDPRSFRLGSFGFSGMVFDVPENRAFYSTRIDLLDRYGIYLDVFAGVNVSDGTIFWEFTSIDPATGEVPVNGFVGFLPPNNTRPEGDGFVSYTVKARRSATTGSRIDALATIVFDQNAPMDTPPIFNTLDASSPDSEVLPLAETQTETRFRVAWTGGDGDIGSGIESFDVYVSENGADYRLWLDDTNLLDAEYLGSVGNTYAFYTVAKDKTGNQEVDPFTPDAITYVFDPFGATDITLPTSAVQPLPVNATSLAISISVVGNDPAGPEGPASGVMEYDLYVATASGAFTKFATIPATNPNTVFVGTSNNVYYFRSVARDNEGNEEIDTGADAFIRVGDFDKPVSQVDEAVANSSGVFTISASGSDSGRIARFDYYVVIDDATPPTLIGSSNATRGTGDNYAGSLIYQGIVDGLPHKYRFFSRAVDAAGNVEDESTTGDKEVRTTFAMAPALQPTGIDVQLGARQRSYLRYVDVLFGDAAGVGSLVTQPNRVRVEKFALNDLTASDLNNSGEIVSPTVAQVGTGNRLRLDFGTEGIGSKGVAGARNTVAGDGFYRVRVDANNDGDFVDVGETLEFYRLLGDADGSGLVDAADTTVIDSLFGQFGSNLDGDLNGDGVVNSADKAFTQRNYRGRSLAAGLQQLLDD